MATVSPKTFLISGVSSGLERAFAAGALEADHRVVGTVRRDGDAEAFAAPAPDRAHPLALDVSGNQPGDPTKAAQALLALIEAPSPPVRLFLGDDALALVEQKLVEMKAEITAWDKLSRSTSFA